MLFSFYHISRRYVKKIIEDVSYINGIPVGETSGLDVPVGRGPSDATRASERVSPVIVQESFFIVARGPVPRERWITRALARETRSHARVACEGPRPTMKGAFCRRPIASRPGGLSYRARIGPTTVVCDRLIANGSGSGDPELQNQRGDRTMARDRPSPYVKERRYFHRQELFSCVHKRFVLMFIS